MLESGVPGEPPLIFGKPVNPIPTGGGQIMPTNYVLVPPSFFSPSGIPEFPIDYSYPCFKIPIK
jgi:hypothetical protein